MSVDAVIVPYRAVSMSDGCRALEWKAPLWTAIENWRESVANESVGRALAVVAVENAVELAMRVAIEEWLHGRPV
jgi:hypothetical protein